MNIKKIVCLMLSAAVFFSICGCGKKNNSIVITKAPFDTETVYDIPKDKTVAVAGGYILSLNGKYGIPVLKKDGCEKEWGVCPSDFLDNWDYEFGTPVSQSSLFIKIYDPEYESFFTVNASEAVAEGRVRIDEIESGLKITYFFDEYEISVPISYILNENGLKIKLLPEEIDENKYTVMSVSVAPFLCSAKNKKDKNRYLFVPSGSGALMYTDQRDDIRIFEEEVYGEDLARENKWSYENSEQIYLPVFGAVDGNTAMYGIITSGAEAASIGAYAGDKNAGYSGVYPVFNIRSYNNVEVNIGGTTGLKKFLKLADKKTPAVFEAQYSILTDNDASYSGIARAYRDYSGLKSGAENKLLNITLLGGLMSNESLLGVPYSAFSATTTFGDAQKIVSELFEDNKTSMNIKLLGFGKTGLDNYKLGGAFDINGKLGNSEQIENFGNVCKKTNSTCYMDYNLVSFSKSGCGYSTRSDTAVDTTDYRVKLYSYDVALRGVDASKGRLYILARNRLGDAVADATEANLKNSFAGISLESLGKMAYSDFEEDRYYGKLNMPGDIADAFKKAKDSVMLSTASSNAYAAVLSDYIDCVPTSSSGLSCLDVDVPFYGMVFSGCIENSVSINLSSTPRKSFLNALKTGSGLSFVISNEVNEAALGNELYISSKYSSCKQKIKEYLNESRDFLLKVSGVCVKSYELLENGISKTEFENGTVLLVNDTAKDITDGDKVIKSMSFIWR